MSVNENNGVIDPKSFKDDGKIDKRSRKFDLSKLIKSLLVEVMEIDSSELNQSQKTTKHARAAKKVLTALYGKRAQKGANALKLNTASAHLTAVRNAVTESGVRHHAFDKSLERIRKNHPYCSYLLVGIDDLNVKDTRLKIRDILEKLRLVKVLENSIKGIKPELTNYASLINKRVKDVPEWADELLSLKTVKKEDRKPALEKLHHIIDESKDFYEELKSMKIDHEVMRHLRKDAFVKDTKATEQKRTLEDKKNNAITIDYVKTMQVVNMLFDYALKLDKWEALAVAIAFATGRRSIEVLMQGQFTKVDKHNLKFVGQAKKREGITDDEMIIYTLVDANKVLEAIENLRSYPNILGLQSLEADRNYSINALAHNRTTGPLNDFINSLLKTQHITELEADSDRNWLFKDTRAIYTKICFELFFKTDPRWKTKDENMFYKELLGHDELDTQAHYMQFKIKNAGGDFKPIVIDADKRRLAAIHDMSSNEWIQATKARRGLHEYVIQIVTEQPWREVLASDLRKGRNYPMVKEYVALMDDKLKLNWLFEAVLDHKAAEVKSRNEIAAVDERPVIKKENTPGTSSKPKFKRPYQNDDGIWLVSFVVDNEEIIEEVEDADDIKQAAETAWQQWNYGKSLPRKAPEPLITKDGDMWRSHINVNGNRICAVWTKSKMESRNGSLSMYRKLLR